ncbi:hypothetical protein [Nocardia paucivorans]|uniref:hypothetical protein n=1 Tax=Nocardia paucivorans TaxID=114259 RepID=UPI0002F8E7D7|nr:hypothetical protein [Nocardia paucivorans]
MNLRTTRKLVIAVVGALMALLPFGVVPAVDPAGPAHAEITTSLGVPQHLGFIAPRIETATAPFESGIGTRFTPAATETVSVTLAGESRPRSIVLHRTRSLDGAPVLTFEQAAPAVGPWAEPDTAFLSYAVTDLDATGRRLADNGFRLVATARDFTFWRGAGGVLVRLIAESSFPAAESGRAGGLGPVRSFTLAPCDIAAVRDQLGTALGVRWKIPMAVPLPWEHTDGAVRPLVHQLHSSDERAPHLSVESPDPAPAQTCAPDRTPVHLVYFTSDVVAAERRLLAAGMTPVARVPMMVTYFRAGETGPYLEVGSTAFELAEYLP